MRMRIASLLLLTVCCLMLAVAPATAGILYSNGPYDGTTAAFPISGVDSVSDSFSVGPNSTITGLDFVYWVASRTDILTTADMQIGLDSFGGSLYHLTGVTNTFLERNADGYYVFQAEYTFAGIPWSDGGFLTLLDACTSTCGPNLIFWDLNYGPSTGWSSGIGEIPSESFTLTGLTTPEPNSLILCGSGILGIIGILRRKLMR
jgi:hypothetical protein